MFAHLVRDLFVAGIEDGPEPGGGAGVDDFGGVIGRFLGNRGDDDLHRRQPQRKPTGIMLDQNPDKALH